VTDIGFQAWWDQQSQWAEGHTYDNAAVTTPALRAFYTELIREFPPMNGPDAPSDEQIDNDPDLEARLTDYSIGTDLVYAAFSWGQENVARDVFRRVASSHGIAIAMVSDDGQIIRP
jgi:hypothetical protein